MKIKGVIIPGLSMERCELPDVPAFLRLQNPEIGDGAELAAPYTVEDIAELHAKTISTLDKDDIFHVIGMSLGGMITSVLASSLRSKLPKKCKFHFFVTSPNLPENPSITTAILEDWKTVKPGDVDGMERVLKPFFSEGFLLKNPEKAANYFKYRATGGNRQSPKAFMRQVTAVLKYDGKKHYAGIDSSECRFVHGGGDRVFNHKHANDLRTVAPNARHETIDELGHMINIENPELFRVDLLKP